MPPQTATAPVQQRRLRTRAVRLGEGVCCLGGCHNQAGFALAAFAGGPDGGYGEPVELTGREAIDVDAALAGGAY